MSDVDETYSVRAATYDKEHSRHWGEGDPLRTTLIRTGVDLYGGLPSENTCVEIGIGTGRMLEVQASTRCRWIGIDRSIDMIRIILSKPSLRTPSVVCGDAHALPLRTASISGAMLVSVLQYLDLDKAASELFRVLRPESKVLVGAVGLHDSDDQGWRNFASRRGYPSAFRRTSEIVGRLSAFGFSFMSSRTIAYRRTFSELLSDKRSFTSHDDLQWAVQEFHSAPPEMKAAYEIDERGFTQYYRVMVFELAG